MRDQNTCDTQIQNFTTKYRRYTEILNFTYHTKKLNSITKCKHHIKLKYVLVHCHPEYKQMIKHMGIEITQTFCKVSYTG